MGRPGIPEHLLEVVAVAAVCRELVSDRSSLESGNIEGNRMHTATGSRLAPTISSICEHPSVPSREVIDADQGKITALQRSFGAPVPITSKRNCGKAHLNGNGCCNASAWRRASEASNFCAGSPAVRRRPPLPRRREHLPQVSQHRLPTVPLHLLHGSSDSLERHADDPGDVVDVSPRYRMRSRSEGSL